MPEGNSGVVLVLLGFYAAGRPSIYASSSFWTSSPTWFAIRLGILMIALTAVYACESAIAAVRGPAAPGAAIDPLARLGRSSLFIYWIHVELVYGLIATPLKGAFSVAGAWAGLGVFCTLMLGAAVLKQWIVAKYHEHRQLRGKLRRQAQALML